MLHECTHAKLPAGVDPQKVLLLKAQWGTGTSLTGAPARCWRRGLPKAALRGDEPRLPLLPLPPPLPLSIGCRSSVPAPPPPDWLLLTSGCPLVVPAEAWLPAAAEGCR